MSEPLTYTIQAKAEDAYNFPDIRLRHMLRQVILNATQFDMTLDEAVQILRDELEYFERPINKALKQ